MKKLIGIVMGLGMLNQCRPSVGEGLDLNPYRLLEQQGNGVTHDTSRLRIGVVKSEGLEREWGKPKLLVGPQGGYGMRYENPRDRNEFVMVYGTPEKYRRAGWRAPYYTDMQKREGGFIEPVEVKQSWQRGVFMGRTTKFCVAEAQSANGLYLYQTEMVGEKSPDGRFGSYRVRIQTKGGSEKVERWLSGFGW